MIKALIDSNICLDLFLKERTEAEAAIEIMRLSEKKSFDGIVAGHAFDTIFYVIEKDEGPEKANQAVSLLQQIVRVGTINQQVIDQTVSARWKDFEDSIHYHCALYESCNVIISRNQKDFSSSDIPVVSPYEFLEQFGEDPE